MSVLHRILLTEGFLSFVVMSLLMVILYFVARFISARTGVNDLLKSADKRIGKLARMVQRVRVLCSEIPAGDNIRRNIRTLKKVIRLQKRASRMLAAYLFDDREDRDVIAAKAIVDGVPNVCRSAIINVVEHGDEDINSKLDNLEAEMERSRALLFKARKLDRKKQLLQM